MNSKDFLPLRNEIKAMAFHLGANAYNVDDVVQEVFLKLCEIEYERGNLDHIEYKGEPNKAYLYMMVRSKIGDIYRGIEREKKEEAAFAHSIELREDISAAFENEELIEEMHKHLDDLHHFPRLVFLAYVNDNHSIRSLSEATKIGAQTLRNEIKYVKETIKRRHSKRSNS